jgi:DNA-binding NarL/FixJ family response regulator
LEVFTPLLRSCARWNTPGLLMVDNPMVVPLLRLAHEKNVEPEFAERVLGVLGVPLDAQLAAGGESLSDRELDVLRVMAEGLANREIGTRLFVSEATVKTHVQHILRKLDAGTRTQAVARARERMLI